MNALVSLFEEAKLVPPLVPPFLMDTTGQRKAIKDLFSIFSALMSALLTSKSISGYWCGAVWGHRNIKHLADFTEVPAFFSETLSETN